MNQPQKSPVDESVNEAQTKKDRAALGWFGLGALMGGLIVAGAMTIINVQKPAVDMDAIRQAAREGAAEAVTALNTPQAGAKNESIDPTPQAVINVVGRPANSQGNASAPVSIIEYSDFNCGFCKKFHSETFSRIIDEYVKTGKARLSYKHFPFLAPSSNWKAQASECAAEQDKFWDYHEALFAGKVNDQGDEAMVRQALNTLAIELQLDATKFSQCMSASDALARVTNDTQEGEQIGVRGTPSFVINGKLLVGAQPYEAFKQAIDAALATP